MNAVPIPKQLSVSSAKTRLTGDGVTKTFAISGLKSSDPNHVLVAINGVLQEPTIDYTVNQGAGTITFATAIPNGAKIVVVALGLYSMVTQRDPDLYLHAFALNAAGTFSYYGLLLNSDIPNPNAASGVGLSIGDIVTFTNLPTPSNLSTSNSYLISAKSSVSKFNISNINSSGLGLANTSITPNVSKVIKQSNGMAYTLESLSSGLFTVNAASLTASVEKWLITRSALGSNGTVTSTAKATNVAWNNRETATYA